MTSRDAWLDHGDKQRKAIPEIVDLLREKGTVDDPGHSFVRDAIADPPFPGASVLRARPRCMLLIGWIYAGLTDSEVARQPF